MIKLVENVVLFLSKGANAAAKEAKVKWTKT